jgi:hypothetical protein
MDDLLIGEVSCTLSFENTCELLHLLLGTTRAHSQHVTTHSYVLSSRSIDAGWWESISLYFWLTLL